MPTQAADWSSVGVGFQSDQRRHAHPEAPPPSSDEAATWTFTNVPAGWYQVQVTWTASADHVTDATYALYDGGTLLTEPVPTVNQCQAPSGADGWQPLKTAYFASGTVVVRLSAISAATQQPMSWRTVRGCPCGEHSFVGIAGSGHPPVKRKWSRPESRFETE